MKKPDFDIADAAAAGAEPVDLARAQDALEKNRDLLHVSGVLALWVGAEHSRPYIMLAVRKEAIPALSEAIPDSVGGISVYYIEGDPG